MVHRTNTTSNSLDMPYKRIRPSRKRHLICSLLTPSLLEKLKCHLLQNTLPRRLIRHIPLQTRPNLTSHTNRLSQRERHCVQAILSHNSGNIAKSEFHSNPFIHPPSNLGFNDFSVPFLQKPPLSNQINHLSCVIQLSSRNLYPKTSEC